MTAQMSALSGKKNSKTIKQDREFKARKSIFCRKNEFSFGHTEFVVPVEHSFIGKYLLLRPDVLSLVYLILRYSPYHHFYIDNSKIIIQSMTPPFLLQIIIFQSTIQFRKS